MRKTCQWVGAVEVRRAWKQGASWLSSWTADNSVDKNGKSIEKHSPPQRNEIFKLLVKQNVPLVVIGDSGFPYALGQHLADYLSTLDPFQLDLTKRYFYDF